MNEMEQKSRIRMLDDLAKEMDRYEADSFRSKDKASEPVAMIEEKQVVPASEVPEVIEKKLNDATAEKPFYQDPNREKVLEGVEANAMGGDEMRKRMMQRGQFGRSRMG